MQIWLIDLRIGSIRMLGTGSIDVNRSSSIQLQYSYIADFPNMVVGFFIYFSNINGLGKDMNATTEGTRHEGGYYGR